MRIPDIWPPYESRNTTSSSHAVVSISQVEGTLARNVIAGADLWTMLGMLYKYGVIAQLLRWTWNIDVFEFCMKIIGDFNENRIVM